MNTEASLGFFPGNPWSVKGYHALKKFSRKELYTYEFNRKNSTNSIRSRASLWKGDENLCNFS